jgi:hypothetical protein
MWWVPSWLLCLGCCMLAAVHWLLSIAYWLLSIGYWLLSVVYCSWYIVYCRSPCSCSSRARAGIGPCRSPCTCSYRGRACTAPCRAVENAHPLGCGDRAGPPGAAPSLRQLMKYTRRRSTNTQRKGHPQAGPERVPCEWHSHCDGRGPPTAIPWPSQAPCSSELCLDLIRRMWQGRRKTHATAQGSKAHTTVRNQSLTG